MQKQSLRLAALASISVLAACTGGQSGILPVYTSANVPASSVLQFAVGTANYNGTPALNTVATFRNKTTGLSATLLNTPSIVGPAGFTVPAVGSAGIDAGTSSMTGTQQTLPGTAPVLSTFGQSGGVFAYGIANLNSTTGGPGSVTSTANFTASGATTGFYREPFYSATQIRPVLGPPAVPAFLDGNSQTNFAGYPSGFASFAGVTLVPGTYALSVLVPSSDPKLVSTINSSATLTSTALLPTFAPPTFASDGAGGGTVTLVVPDGVTETIVYVRDLTQTPSGGLSVFYAFLVSGTGPQTLAIPDNLGPTSPTIKSSATLQAGDSIFISAVGFDYPALEAAPPKNVSPNPTIVGANGQADLTASPVTTGTE